LTCCIWDCGGFSCGLSITTAFTSAAGIGLFLSLSPLAKPEASFDTSLLIEAETSWLVGGETELLFSGFDKTSGAG